MRPPPPLPLLDMEDFVRLGETVLAACGVVLREEQRPRDRAPSGPPAGGAGADRLRGLSPAPAPRIRSGPEELDFLLDAVTTHETYFFRESRQLEVFCEEVLPLLAARNRALRRLRLWSAGCASGEEAYTLAMLVLDSGLFEGWDIGIFGTDLSRRVLGQARRAEYGASSLRATSSDLRQRHFEDAGTGRWTVREAARSRVTFAHVNLLEPAGAALLPEMDAVFCRNVLIYLDHPARRRVLELLHARLRGRGLSSCWATRRTCSA